MDTATFTRIAKAVASANQYRLGKIAEPGVTSNFWGAEFTYRVNYQDAKRYLLCSCDERWAVCSSVNSGSPQLEECAEIAATLKSFYGIEVGTKAEMDAEFELPAEISILRNMDTTTFTRIAKAVASANKYRLVSISEPGVTPNFWCAEYTCRINYQDAKRYLLCSCDERWALCSSLYCGHPQFEDCAEIAATLKAFYGIELGTKAEMDAEFELTVEISCLSGFGVSALKYWNPQTMGAALFNWWD
ncbi:MAG: hypothetical protein PHQ60_16480 [Sideroxydans sp.]|nr:hypothetical protein [Sideroxydans sp.]